VGNRYRDGIRTPRCGVFHASLRALRRERTCSATGGKAAAGRLKHLVGKEES
jgi:hypothetical protein